MQMNILGAGTAPRDRDPGLRDPRVFATDDTPPDEAALAKLAHGTADADLAAPPVVLPDFHHKAKMEMPSSIAVATRATIRPTLTSASVNCGMALVALEAPTPDRAAITRFYREVRERYPFPRSRRFELSAGDVVRCAAEGGGYAVERFGVDPEDLDRVERGGRLDLAPYGDAAALRRRLPWTVVQLSRMRFGSIGPSNHFVELQVVEEVIDEPVATKLGVRPGQLTLQYHGGGGVLTGELGALFGRRKHMPRPLAVQMAVQKPAYHLATARSVADLKRRMALYFSGGCPPVPWAGSEGDRLLLANAAAMNYGFAYRLASYASLRAIAARTLGATGGRLVVDSPHNSIYEEEVDGAPALVHRHNSCRAYPASRMAGHPVFAATGQPVLLPGTNRTSSYLCVGSEGAASSLYTACHGAGTIIDSFARRGLSGRDPRRRTTLRYRYTDGEPDEVAQLDDRGINEALGILARHDLVRPVARLRPLAVLT
jgi:tRNA-splicing ligase RtcB